MSRTQAVVVTYNRKEILTKCIDAILGQSVQVEKLILVDNNSTDGTEDFLKQKGYLDKPVIQYIKLPDNVGGAGGFYEGMKAAREGQPDWVWIMDDDVIPERNCLEELIKAKDDIQGKVSFLASAVRGLNDEAMNVPKIFKNQFTAYTDWYKYLDDSIVQVVKATFVSLLINIEAINQCGLPWAKFFIWGDDSEYTQRVIRDYGPAYMVGKSKAIHERAGSDELSIVKEQNKARIPLYFYYYRNNFIGFWEYEDTLYKFLCLGKWGWDLLRVIAKGKYKMQKIGVMFRAFFSFVFGTYGRKDFKNRANL